MYYCMSPCSFSVRWLNQFIAREDALTVRRWVSGAHSRRLAGAGSGPAPSQRSPDSLAAVSPLSPLWYYNIDLVLAHPVRGKHDHMSAYSTWDANWRIYRLTLDSRYANTSENSLIPVTGPWFKNIATICVTWVSSLQLKVYLNCLQGMQVFRKD